MKRLWELDGMKPTTAQFFLTLDLTQWLGTESITGVTFTAKNADTGEVVTTTVIDTTKCTYTGALVKPFIRAGASGNTYVVKMEVTTNSTPETKDSFYIQFSVQDY